MPHFYCCCAFHWLRPASARFETTPLAPTDRTTPRLPNCCEIFESPLRSGHRQTGDSCRSVAVVLVVRSARSNTGEARRAVRRGHPFGLPRRSSVARIAAEPSHHDVGRQRARATTGLAIGDPRLERVE